MKKLSKSRILCNFHLLVKVIHKNESMNLSPHPLTGLNSKTWQFILSLKKILYHRTNISPKPYSQAEVCHVKCF